LLESKWEEKKEPLILEPKEPEKVKVIIVTEGPNRSESSQLITSVVNHPTFTFLQALFKGNFRPVGEGSNAYWTHVRKCFLNGTKAVERRARKQCKDYLNDEIDALKPAFILCIGKTAYMTVIGESKKLEDVFYNQIKGINQYEGKEHIKFEWAVIPHPSGLNRFWNKPTVMTLEVINLIQNRLLQILCE